MRWKITGAAVLVIYAYRRWVLRGDCYRVPAGADPSRAGSQMPTAPVGGLVVLFLDEEPDSVVEALRQTAPFN